MPFPKITLGKIRNLALYLSILIVVGGVSYRLGEKQAKLNLSAIDPREILVINKDQPGKYREVDFSLFWRVWEELEKSYIDPTKVDSEQMVYGAIKGMTASLGDLYTAFLPPTDNKQNKENLSGSFYGVGIQIGFKDRRLAVIAPLEGMPAEEAGIKAGDFIFHIRDSVRGTDRDTDGISLPEAVSLIRGDKGTQVSLTVYREGLEEPEEITVKRDEIVIPSVELAFVSSADEELVGEVAHLKLLQFGERTEKEWEAAVSEIVSRERSLAGVVLDMRNNPGGFLNGAVDIASEFISEGTIVVQQGRSASETFSVSKRGKFFDIPVVVLINGGSASASEIVAGALRDRRSVQLIGEQTFGKGTVQVLRDFSGGAGLHVTTSKWILPSGQAINDKGLAPDVEVVLENGEDEEIDEQLEKAIAALVGN